MTTSGRANGERSTTEEVHGKKDLNVAEGRRAATDAEDAGRRRNVRRSDVASKTRSEDGVAPPRDSLGQRGARLRRRS